MEPLMNEEDKKTELSLSSTDQDATEESNEEGTPTEE